MVHHQIMRVHHQCTKERALFGFGRNVKSAVCELWEPLRESIFSAVSAPTQRDSDK